MSFADLKLIEPLLKALAEEGYTAPTPVQVQAIPHVLAGRDLLGIAQTGTGKTAAFALPIMQRLVTTPSPVPAGSGRPPVRVLVITPTRELASQIGEAFRAYGRYLRLTTTVIYGGVGQGPQVQALARGVDILVATPGRLIDLLRQGCVRLSGVEVCVLDEADRMLDMGFLPDVRRLLAMLPRQRQTLFFSATMAGEPAELARGILRDPARVEVTPTATTVERIRQSVIYVEKPSKQDVLEKLLRDPAMVRTLVFTRTKHGANKVVTRLMHAGFGAEAIHANKSQSQRERALAGFRAGRTAVLVATDIAARGIDVDGITHVVNFDLPNVPESYVHRIGRTARAGADGAAISFCDRTERAYLRDIEREIRMRIPVLEGGPPRIEGAPERPPARPPLEARPEGEASSGPERRYGGPRHDGPRRDDAPSRPQGGGHGGGQRRSGGFRHREARGPVAPAGPDTRGPDARGQDPRGPRDDRPRGPVSPIFTGPRPRADRPWDSARPTRHRRGSGPSRQR